MAVLLEDMTMEELGEWVIQKFGSEVKDASYFVCLLHWCMLRDHYRGYAHYII